MPRISFLLKSLLMLLLFTALSHAKDIPTDNQIQGRLNIVNGTSAECVMHKFYINSGWTQIKGNIGRQGIDGLYYKKKHNIIKEILVSESKWNTSRLGRSGKNKAVKQMSQEWVLRSMDRLIKKNPSMTYRTLRRHIENDQYRARIFRLKPKDNNKIEITIYRVKNKGLKAFDEIKDTQLKPIDINSPSNSFERQVVQAFNECRSKYLHKYLSVLSNLEINELLKDNYIQKKDVSALLR